MRFLVDANIISEVTRPQPDSGVVRWLEINRREIVVDPIVLGELHLGILALPKGKKRTQLQHWFQSVSDRVECVAWDAATALAWAELVVSLRRRGKSMPTLDSMIAASAKRHRLTLATRNVRDFRFAGIEVLNPFS